MKFIFSSRESIDVEFEGKRARFSGELCAAGFAATATSMQWLSPDSHITATEKERLELMDMINRFYANHYPKDERVYFVDNQGRKL